MANIKLWIDRGDNMGVQCLDCGRTHWDENLPTLDPTTGKDCANCIEIKKQELLKKAQEQHNSEGDECKHTPSQPKE